MKPLAFAIKFVGLVALLGGNIPAGVAMLSLGCTLAWLEEEATEDAEDGVPV